MNPDIQQQTTQLLEAMNTLHRDLSNLTFTLYVATVIVAIILLILMFRKMK
jgi:hypothetical protein